MKALIAIGVVAALGLGGVVLGAAVLVPIRVASSVAGACAPGGAGPAAVTPAEVGGSWTPEQVGNAGGIVATARGLGLPPRAAVVGVATAIQESGLRNLAHGDRDSLGLFQQRPSQGWGSPRQLLDPGYAAAQFLAHLVRLPNWSVIPLGQAAQAVQRSADGSGQSYARWEGSATQLVAQLWSGAAPGAENAACELQTMAVLSGLPWPVATPIPQPGWLERIPVPHWPSALPGARVNPPAITPQCVAGALWSWATVHLADPAWPLPPSLGVATAAAMYPAAVREGYSVAAQPLAGSMVVWGAGAYYSADGHVGTVIAVEQDRYEVVEQNFLGTTSDLGAHWGSWDLRSIAWPDANVEGFIVGPPGR